MMESWQLISRGSAEAFVSTLRAEAETHPGVQHPYLRRLAAGDLPSVRLALMDYAHQYSFYSSHFPQYLESVINTLESADHRSVLYENLEEEQGNPKSDDPRDAPHTEIFAQFKEAVGIDTAYREANPPSMTALLWRDLALQKCRSEQTGVGIGAIGIGTEMVVPAIYEKILEAIRSHTDLREEEYYFFTLHAECDHEHAADLIEITLDLAATPRNREAMRFGVHSALNLRKAFWDIMLSRALDLQEDA